jgi:hypothetical protein
MIAIKTEVVGSQSRKGPRIKATCKLGGVVLGVILEAPLEGIPNWDVRNHREVALILATRTKDSPHKTPIRGSISSKVKWDGEFTTGELPDGSFAHVFQSNP